MISDRIDSLLTKDNLHFIKKYVLVSLLSYSFIFLGLYFCVNFLKLTESISFLIVYGINYIMVYALQLKVVFLKNHSPKTFIKFLISLLTFYALGNLIYNLLIAGDIHYLVSTIITIVILFPLRFYVLKFIVYK